MCAHTNPDCNPDGYRYSLNNADSDSDSYDHGHGDADGDPDGNMSGSDHPVEQPDGDGGQLSFL